MNSDNERTTITISKTLKTKLENLGSKKDDWESLLDSLADFWIRYKGDLDHTHQQ